MKLLDGSIRGRATLVAACAAMLLVAAPSASGASARKVSLLYTLNAGRARMTPEKGSANRYRLAVKRPGRQVVWFADRPVRKSGAFPAADLVGDWKGFGFVADPPNAAVDYVDRRGRTRTAIVTLRRPRLHGREFIFDAGLVGPGGVDGNLAAHALEADMTPARRMRSVALFIDDTRAPVVEGCILQPHTVCPGVTLERSANGAHLGGADLKGATFEAVAGIELEGAELTEAHFSGPSSHLDLEDANLTGGSLSGSFAETSLRGANLTDASLAGVYFWRSNLGGANTTGTSTVGTEFCETELPDGTRESLDACRGLVRVPAL